MIILKSVLLIAIVAVAMIAAVTPSVFAETSVQENYDPFSREQCRNETHVIPDKYIYESGEKITFTVEIFDPCYPARGNGYYDLELWIKGHVPNELKSDAEVRKGFWNRESNRGIELDGKTVGIIGYGNMGKAFARKLKGFDVEVLCYDIAPGVGDHYARQVTLKEFRNKIDVLSLHTPQTSLTLNMIDSKFINEFKKSFWLINTARGKSLITSDLVTALKNDKILGAALDVLEYEKSSFENLFSNEMPEALQYLINSDKVLLTPHIAGWTLESKEYLAQTIVAKIKDKFNYK